MTLNLSCKENFDANDTHEEPESIPTVEFPPDIKDNLQTKMCEQFHAVTKMIELDGFKYEITRNNNIIYIEQKVLDQVIKQCEPRNLIKLRLLMRKWSKTGKVSSYTDESGVSIVSFVRHLWFEIFTS